MMRVGSKARRQDCKGHQCCRVERDQTEYCTDVGCRLYRSAYVICAGVGVHSVGEKGEKFVNG